MFTFNEANIASVMNLAGHITATDYEQYLTCLPENKLLARWCRERFRESANILR
jgi:hypothetical protein